MPCQLAAVGHHWHRTRHRRCHDSSADGPGGRGIPSQAPGPWADASPYKAAQICSPRISKGRGGSGEGGGLGVGGLSRGGSLSPGAAIANTSHNWADFNWALCVDCWGLKIERVIFKWNVILCCAASICLKNFSLAVSQVNAQPLPAVHGGASSPHLAPPCPALQTASEGLSCLNPVKAGNSNYST